jgi:serine phosphatase RsbU (regulator of sigma subunit)
MQPDAETGTLDRIEPRLRPENPHDALAEWVTPEILEGMLPFEELPSPCPRYAPYQADVEAPSFHWEPALQLDAAQRELDTLKSEVNLLRRRDETLQFYMTRLDEELRLAARLQQDFLPKTLPQVGLVYFHVLFRPAGYVSGDLYDVVRLDETHVGFFIVDAVGHGMPAALLTMFIKRALICKEIGPAGYRLLPPEETLRRVNEALIEQHLSAATFATALYGVIDTETLILTLSTAGHPAPLLLRGDEMIPIQVDGSLLGIFEQETYRSSVIQLERDDRLLVYSDGVEVAFGKDIALHRGQWRDELYERRDLPAEGMIIDFSDQIDREAGSLQPKDDLTLMVVEIK